MTAIAMETRQGGNAVPSRSDDSVARRETPSHAPRLFRPTNKNPGDYILTSKGLVPVEDGR